MSSGADEVPVCAVAEPGREVPRARCRRSAPLEGIECRVAETVLGALVRRDPGHNVVISPHALTRALLTVAAITDDPGRVAVASLLGNSDFATIAADLDSAEVGLRGPGTDDLSPLLFVPGELEREPAVFHVSTALSLWRTGAAPSPDPLARLAGGVRPEVRWIPEGSSQQQVRALLDDWFHGETGRAIHSVTQLPRWNSDSVVVAATLQASVEAAFASPDRAAAAATPSTCSVRSRRTGSFTAGFTARPRRFYSDREGTLGVMMHKLPHAELHLLLPPDNSPPTLMCPPIYNTTTGDPVEFKFDAEHPYVDVCYPQFEAETAVDLRNIAADLGIGAVFAPEAPSRRPSDPVEHGRVSSILSLARFKVGEHATINAEAPRGWSDDEARLAVKTHSCHADLAFDRPFFALLRDRATGALLYAAYISADSH